MHYRICNKDTVCKAAADSQSSRNLMKGALVSLTGCVFSVPSYAKCIAF